MPKHGKNGTMGDLKRALDEVNAGLQDLRRKRRMTEDALRRSRGTRIQRTCAEVAGRLLAAAGDTPGDREAVAVFWRVHVGAQREEGDPMLPGQVPAAHEVLEPLAESQVEPAQLAAGDSAAGRVRQGRSRASARRRADGFRQEFELHRWVRGLNEGCGVAPSSAEVWSRWLQLGESPGRPVPEAVRTAARSRKHQLQWVHRWRLRWRVRYRAVPPGAGLTREALEDKAGAQNGEGG